MPIAIYPTRRSNGPTKERYNLHLNLQRYPPPSTPSDSQHKKLDHAGSCFPNPLSAPASV